MKKKTKQKLLQEKNQKRRTQMEKKIKKKIYKIENTHTHIHITQKHIYTQSYILERFKRGILTQ